MIKNIVIFVIMTLFIGATIKLLPFFNYFISYSLMLPQWIIYFVDVALGVILINILMRLI